MAIKPHICATQIFKTLDLKGIELTTTPTHHAELDGLYDYLKGTVIPVLIVNYSFPGHSYRSAMFGYCIHEPTKIIIYFYPFYEVDEDYHTTYPYKGLHIIIEKDTGAIHYED